MHKIAEDTKQFYLEHPELFEKRSHALWEHACEFMKRLNVPKPVFDSVKIRFEKEKKLWWSYWVFPVCEDIEKMIDTEYARYTN